MRVALAISSLTAATTSACLARKSRLARKKLFCTVALGSIGSGRAFCFSSAMAKNGSQIDQASIAPRENAEAASAGAR